MASWWDRLTGAGYLKGPPRRLREEDYYDFFTSAEGRKGAMTREQIIEYLERKNYYRWWRLRHDYKWLRKQMKKLGQNPDDARELL